MFACLTCESEIVLCEYIRKAQDMNRNYFIVGVKFMLKVKMNFCQNNFKPPAALVLYMPNLNIIVLK